MKMLKTFNALMSFENAPEKTKLVMNSIFEAADFYRVNRIQIGGEDKHSFNCRFLRADGRCIARHDTNKYTYSKRQRMAIEKAWLITDYVDEKLKTHPIFTVDKQYLNGWEEIKVLSDGGGHEGAYAIKMNDVIPGVYEKSNAGYWKKVA